MTKASDKARELATAINKAVGVDTMKLGNDPKFAVSYLATGVLPIDVLLQGGLPRGRFTMLYGDFSTLKSYIGYSAIAATQQAGGTCALIDTEHAYDEEWAQQIGIDTEALLLEHPATGELAIDVAEAMIRSEEVDLIVFDSVAATVPQAEADKRLYKENVQPARIAQLMSVASRKLTTANSGKTAILWINQVREAIGVMFGSPEKITGGRALPYYSSYMVNLKKVGKITRDKRMFTGEKFQNTKEQVGQKFRAELTKSKLSKPFAEQWFDWSLTDGQIDIVGYCINQAVDMGNITITGKTWQYAGLKSVGRENFRKKLAANPHAITSLEQDVRIEHGLAAKQVGKKRPIKRKLTK